MKPFFIKDYYYSEKELQDDFRKFLKKDYSERVLVSFEKSVDVDITFLLNENRWSLCSVCNRPFISINRTKKSKTCYWQPYISYTEEGRAFKSNKKHSRCWMKKNLEYSKNYLEKQKGE